MTLEGNSKSRKTKVASARAKPSGGRDQRRKDWRKDIIMAAGDLFRQHGFHGTTMSAVATSIGCSKETLWRYFRSKEDLFSAYIEDAMQAFREELTINLTQSTKLGAGLLRFAVSFLHKVTEPERRAFHQLVIGEVGRSPEVGRIFHDSIQVKTNKILAEFLKTRIADGDKKAIEAADFFQSLCSGTFFFDALIGVIEPTEAEIWQQAERFVELFLLCYPPNPEN